MTPLVHEPDDLLPEWVALALPNTSHGALSLYASARLANASRALRISFPTVESLLGEEAFDLAAMRFAQHWPHGQSDWGQWGEAFPSWLAEQIELSSWPYLSDVAQLDWLCHTSERAHDTEPTVQLMRSDFPVVAIWWAHHGPTDERGTWMAAAKQAMSSGETRFVVVHRAHWRATPAEISSGSYESLSSVLAGQPE